MGDIYALAIGYGMATFAFLSYLVILGLNITEKQDKILKNMEHETGQRLAKEMATEGGPKVYKKPGEKNKVVFMSDGDRARKEQDEKESS